MNDSRPPLFLGLDSSTQSLKAVAIDADLQIAHEESVNFDADLPDFGTEGGVHHHADGLTVTSPALMWVAALDLLLSRMQSTGFEFARVVAISGSGQQHGSVFLKRGARQTLARLDPDKPLRVLLAEAFSVTDSPIWMDSSTGDQCAKREEALGGAQATADLTGSRAYERFTGNQIAKIYETQPAAYADAERICLVSSFIPSLLAGDYVAIDAADGAGMNLMDIRKRAWSQPALDCTAPELRPRLGAVVASHTVVGAIHPYFVDRYDLSPTCKIIAFSGDNPCSLAGLRLQHSGDIAISLGTSDTMFGSLTDPQPSASEGHIFANPVDPEGYMAMVCYKNGSLTREHVRDNFADGTWDGFNAVLAQTPPGNNGYIGFYIKEPEITPPILTPGTHRFDAAGAAVDAFADGADVRAVVEGQFLSMRLHGGNIGIRPESILATGGASANEAIVRVLSNVFGAPVYTAEIPDTASLGAAYRAVHGWRCQQAGEFVAFSEVMANAPAFRKCADPDKAAHEAYTAMLTRYAEHEATVIAAAG